MHSKMKQKMQVKEQVETRVGKWVSDFRDWYFQYRLQKNHLHAAVCVCVCKCVHVHVASETDTRGFLKHAPQNSS